MKVTIFTPTFNRADTLPRLFVSLQQQTDKRFEWLIVDDGSTDNTAQLIHNFTCEKNDFEIRYYFQEHGGKPRAQNLAIDLARGELFITCDSNKYLSRNAVELIIGMAEGIRDVPMMCGVGGYRADFSGKPFGGSMQLDGRSFVDCTRLEGHLYNIVGDKASAFFTDVLKNYKSPEYPDEFFVSESVWLIPMAIDGYKTRWFPEILIYGEYTADGLTKQGANSRAGHTRNFQGFLHQLRVEIMARGTKAMRFLIYEAIDIAKEKDIPMKSLAIKIGCSQSHLIYLKAIRYMHKLYGSISRLVKKFIGSTATSYLKKLMHRQEQ